MVVGLVLTALVVVFCVLVAFQPRLIDHRRDRCTNDELDESLRLLPQYMRPVLPLSFAVPAGTAGVIGILLGRPSGPAQLLFAASLVALAVIQHRTLPRSLEVLRRLGAYPDDPASDAARFRARQRRWYATGLWTTAVGQSLRVLSGVEGLNVLLAPSIAVTLVGMIVLTAAVWRTLRGPHRSPWIHRGR